MGHAKQSDDIERVSELLDDDLAFCRIVNQVQPSGVQPGEGEKAGYCHRGYLSCHTRFGFFIMCSSFIQKAILLRE
jgi:hypothetical protein